MDKTGNKRKRFFANQLHRQVFVLIFLAAFLPALLITICLYFLIFNITSLEIGIPEFIAYNIIPAAQRVTVILLITAPLTIILILIAAYKISHRIVGPFDRIIRELDEHLAGARKGHVILRKFDKFWPLVERINKLLDRAKVS